MYSRGEKRGLHGGADRAAADGFDLQEDGRKRDRGMKVKSCA